MNFIVALIPVIIVVSLGRILAWKKLPPPEGWRAIDRLCYVLLFPVLVVNILATADLTEAPWKIALALMGGQIILAGIGLFSHWSPNITRPAIGTIVQSNVRWNAMIALPIAGALFGDKGFALVAVAAACMMPLANSVSVFALSHYGHSADGVKRNPFLEMARNPIIQACVVGIALNLLNLRPTGVIKDTMDIIGGGAVPLGLLTAGAGVDLSALKRAGARTFFWALLRLFGQPMAAGLIAIAVHAPPQHLAVVVICAATPTATTGYVVAQVLGGDAPLAANLIAVQSIFAIVTMPIVFWLMTSVLS